MDDILQELQSKLPPISIRAEPLFFIPTPFGNLGFTNSMLFTLIVMAALVIFFLLATRKMTLVPRGIQNLGESLVEFLLGVCEGTAGKAVGRRIFPLIATLFLFIIVANWSGLLPGVGTIGHCEREIPKVGEAASSEANASGSALPTTNPRPCERGTVFVPYLRAANADLNTTLSMALIAVTVVQISGIAAHGLRGYIRELVTPVFLAPIHIMGEISRVISLSFRLFGNIFGGEVLVTVMYVLLGSVFVGFGTIIFLGLELLFGFIQALLFSLLTLVYIATAVGGHSAGGHDGTDQAHAAPGSPEAVGIQVGAKLTGQTVPGTPPRSGTERPAH